MVTDNSGVLCTNDKDDLTTDRPDKSTPPASRDDLVSGKLKRSAIYRALVVKSSKEGDQVDAAVKSIILEAGDYCYQKSKTIIRHMPEFTLHDEEHIFNVLQIMEKLIPDETLKFLSVPELMLLILTAFFHDIGMAPEERQIRAWKRDWQNGGDSFEVSEYDGFERFCKTYPDKKREMARLRKIGKDQQAQLILEFLISEYIRETHTDRARILISRDWKDRIKYKTTDLTSEFAQLCFSHNQDASLLLNMEPCVLCDDQTYVCMPFVGVILRLSDLLDFDSKRTPSVLYSHLSVRNPVSIAEWKKHRAISSWNISSSQITFAAKCSHPAIEASIRHFFDLIDAELKNCTHVLTHISDSYIQDNLRYYRIPLPPSVDRTRVGARLDISTGKPIYVYKDTQFNLNKNQVIELLMGTNLYDKPEVALRELIQNSIDACLVRSQLEVAWGNAYSPKIIVRYHSEDGLDFLEVEDNGLGMNQHIIDTYYAKIGSSYYRSREFYDLLAHVGADFKPISRFGIGILSCFMVSDSIEVQTRRQNPDQELDSPLNIVIEGYDSIFYIKEGTRKTPGTTSKLQLRGENPWKRMSEEQFVSSVKSSVPNPPFDIDIVTDKGTVKHDKSFFQHLAPESLRRNDWESDANVREVAIQIEDKEHGFFGQAIVGILEQNGQPIGRLELLNKPIMVEGQLFELSLSLKYDMNEIEKTTTSIDVANDGNILSNTHYMPVMKSRSAFSIHGIELPTGLFPDYFNMAKQATLRWPFPILLVLDITSPVDIDLNSSRTEIVNNFKWQKFEVDLSYVIIRTLFSALQIEYVKRLLPIYQSCKSDNFRIGLARAIDELSLEEGVTVQSL